MAEPTIIGVNYFDHQFLRRDDFDQAREYAVERQRQHTRLLHLPGVLEGLVVSVAGGVVSVSQGRAVDLAGQEVVLQSTGAEHPVQVRVQTGPSAFHEYESTVEAAPTALLRLDLSRFPPGPTVAHVSIRGGRQPFEPTQDVGLAGMTRLAERAVVEVGSDPPDAASGLLPLATVTRLAGQPFAAATPSGKRAGAVLADASVGTAKLADLAVTMPKLANGAVTAAKIAPGIDLAVGSLTVEKTAVVKGGSWDLGATEGDLKVGDATYRFKVGVALVGGGAGDVRLRAQGGTNRLYLGSGTADVVAVQNGSLGVLPSSRLEFGNATRQMINLWGTDYGIGVQGDTQYFRTSQRFAWFSGGVHHDGPGNPGGGVRLMEVRGGDLVLSGRTNPQNLPGGSLCRALVDYDRQLIVNFNNDFDKGVFIASALGVGGDTALNGRLTVGGGNWDVGATEGDLKVGNDTYRLKVGVALGGGGAGDVRLRAQGGTNRLYLGSGSEDVVIIQNGSLRVLPSSRLEFVNATRQMINLWGTEYGIGVQGNTQYSRTDQQFAWFRGGVHDDGAGNPGAGGIRLMALSGAGDLILSGRTNPQNLPTGSLCRALVDWNQQLIINFNNDFNKGVVIGSALGVGGDTALNGRLTVGSRLEFGNATRQMINLWGTEYGIGVQGNTQYFRTDQHFAWFRGGVHHDGAGNPGGGVRLMALNASGDLILSGRTNPQSLPNGSLCRALVDYDNLLIVNCGNDFTKGVLVDSALVVGRGVTIEGGLTVKGTLTASAKAGYLVDHFVNHAGGAVEQGDVVVLGEAGAAGYWARDNDIPIPEVDLASRPYDRRVCGIVDKVTTAGALPFAEAPPAPARRGRRGKAADDAPGHPLQRYAAPEEEGLDPRTVGPGQMGSMVTQGAFAYCKVDADAAPIEVGDLLTTSATPGHAQKAVDPAAAVGAIVGKAIAPLAKGRGKIPVMVLLQ